MQNKIILLIWTKNTIVICSSDTVTVSYPIILGNSFVSCSPDNYYGRNRLRHGNAMCLRWIIFQCHLGELLEIANYFASYFLHIFNIFFEIACKFYKITHLIPICVFGWKFGTPIIIVICLICVKMFAHMTLGSAHHKLLSYPKKSISCFRGGDEFGLYSAC